MDRIESDMLGDLPPETVEVVRDGDGVLRPLARGDQPAAPSASARFTRRVAIGPGMASSAEGVSDASLFAGLFGHGEVAGAVSDRALVDAMVEFEVALAAGARCAWARARPRRREELAAAVEQGTLELDVAELGRATGEQGTPVPGLLRALRRQLSGGAAAHLHKGATSQDVLDTAMMLVTRRALDL